MRLGLISQVKNEIDIIVPFLEHIDSLFDCVYLLDHQSIDGTTNLLKQAISQRNSWKYYYLDFKGQYQKKVANYFIPKIFLENIDFLFFLDADEFINVENRKMLEINLSRLLLNSQIGRLQWINTSPKTFEQNNFSFSTPLIKSPNLSYYGKVVLPKNIYLSDPDITIETGNHHVRNRNKETLPESEIGEIIHIPIRSKDQAIKKAVITGITKAAKNLPTTGNYKYLECLNLIAKGELDKQGIIKLIHIYESPQSRYDHQNYIDAYWNKSDAISLEGLNVSKSRDLKLNDPEDDTPLYAIIADLLVKQSGNFPLDFNFFLDNEVVKIEQQDGHKALESVGNNEIIPLHSRQEESQTQTNWTALKIARMKNKEKDLLIKGLRKELAATRGKVNFYKNSKSWKITKPLRAIMNLIRGKE